MTRDKIKNDLIQVRVPSSLGEAIRRAARRDERSVSNFVRYHLRPVVERSEQPEERQAGARQ